MKTFKTGNTDNEIEGVDYEVIDVSPNWPSMFANAVHQIKAIVPESDGQAWLVMMMEFGGRLERFYADWEDHENHGLGYVTGCRFCDHETLKSVFTEE